MRQSVSNNAPLLESIVDIEGMFYSVEPCARSFDPNEAHHENYSVTVETFYENQRWPTTGGARPEVKRFVKCSCPTGLCMNKVPRGHENQIVRYCDFCAICNCEMRCYCRCRGSNWFCDQVHVFDNGRDDDEDHDDDDDDDEPARKQRKDALKKHRLKGCTNEEHDVSSSTKSQEPKDRQSCQC